MRRTGTTLTLAAALLLGACNPSGGGGEALGLSSIGQLEACLGNGLNSFIGSLGGLAPLLAVAANPDGAAALGVTWTEATPTVYNFTIPADLDGDGAPDGQFDGSATFDRAPSEGLLPGDGIQIEWTLSGHPSLTGDGNIHVRLAPDGIELWGQIDFEDPAGDCTFSLSATELLPLTIQIPGAWPPAVTAAHAGTQATVTGSGTATASAGPNTLSTILLFFENSVNATNVIATVGGAQKTLPNRSISFGSGPPPPVAPGRLADWIGTWDISYVCVVRGSGSRFTGQEVFTITAPTAMGLKVDFEDLGDGLTGTFTIDMSVSPTQGTFAYDTPTNADGGFTERGEYRLENVGGSQQIRKDSMYGPWKTLTNQNARGDCTISSSSKR